MLSHDCDGVGFRPGTFGSNRGKLGDSDQVEVRSAWQISSGLKSCAGEAVRAEKRKTALTWFVDAGEDLYDGCRSSSRVLGYNGSNRSRCAREARRFGSNAMFGLSPTCFMKNRPRRANVRLPAATFPLHPVLGTTRNTGNCAATCSNSKSGASL